jgi:transposase
LKLNVKKLMTKILNLPGVIVEESLEAEETIILSVRAKNTTAVCPRCGQTSHRLHQNKRHSFRDLSMTNREVIIKVNRRQFKCESYKKHFIEILDFVELRKNFTQRYAQSITEQVINSNINNVARNNKLTAKQVKSMVMAAAKSVMKVDLPQLCRLGIEQISLVKGQGKFIVVLVDLETHKLLGLALERKQSEIEIVMLLWGDKVLSQIE